MDRYCQTSIPKKKIITENTFNKYNNLDSNLKSPIISVMGHVDAGKSSLINIIKNINITDDEAGGITQTINSYFVNINDIVNITKNITGKFKVEPKVPGILCIDTPGHMAFSKIREQSSSLCDIAILVVDLIEGVKPQTIESIKILQEHKIPFIISATKLDRVDGYNTTEYLSLNDALKEQNNDTKILINTYVEDLKYELDKYNVKSEFYFKNKKPQNTYSIVPISNKTKEGLADLLSLIIYISENWMGKKIQYSENVDMIVMNNYNDNNMGWIIEGILKNGTINIGEKYSVMSTDGPKSISIRNLIIDNKYVKSVRASNGVKIIASNANNIYSGTNLIKHNKKTEKWALTEVENNFKKLWDNYKLIKNSIMIMAPTFGELDALYNVFNKKVSYIDVGKLTEKSINKTQGIWESYKEEENKCFIYFGKLSDRDYDYYYKYCRDIGIQFLASDIVYVLKDEYEKYKEMCVINRQNDLIKKGEAIYPCRLKIYKSHIYMKGGCNHIMLGVKVKEGRVRIGMPIMFSLKFDDDLNNLKSDKGRSLGKVISLQKNNKDVEEANEGDEICIRFENPSALLYGRHFDYRNKLISEISRNSIDILKKDYRDKMTKKDWKLIIELKNELNIK
jgi:translation initiation factor 5B